MKASIQIGKSANNSKNLVECDIIAQKYDISNNIMIGVLSFKITASSYGVFGKFLGEIEDAGITIIVVHIDRLCV